MKLRMVIRNSMPGPLLEQLCAHSTPWGNSYDFCDDTGTAVFSAVGELFRGFQGKQLKIYRGYALVGLVESKPMSLLPRFELYFTQDGQNLYMGDLEGTGWANNFKLKQRGWHMTGSLTGEQFTVVNQVGQTIASPD